MKTLDMNIKSFFSSIAIVAILMGVFLFVKCSGGGSGSSSGGSSNDSKKPHPGEPEMVFVQGGTFTMGCTRKFCENDVKPTHQVTLSNFSIGKYPVTQKEWVAVMGSNPSYFKGDNLPVETVSWNDAQKFIAKLNEATGKKYRLPTEAEWEYAARGGNKSKGFKYSGSNTPEDVAWCRYYSDEKTHPVGTKAPNELGIYDMSGNVWEWCNDWYGDYSNTAKTNPQGPSSGSYRVLRGVSWQNYARDCCVCDRNSYWPNLRFNIIGFRLVLVP